ncbi:GntR family transcriptional regulator [Rhodoplanes sp. SY1]|uniref:GntR family transcriptional regulator n=1 Tax=Rhodoplanes sp. SY1 TaxID=3166646 RepID=UPI0038B41C21
MPQTRGERGTRPKRKASAAEAAPPAEKDRERDGKLRDRRERERDGGERGGERDRGERDKGASLSDRAYQQIKEMILTLFFLPGQYLNEAAICDLLKLGRTPVHQALQLLQVEGLVEVVPRKGVIVRPDSINEVVEILDARILVEVELVRRAVANSTREDIKELTAILEKTNRRHGGGSLDAFVESDRAFHVKLSAMSGNAILADFVRLMHERSTRFWYLHLWQTVDVYAAGREHRTILEAMETRDPERAARAMRKHIENLRERLQHILHHGPGRGGVRPAAAPAAQPRTRRAVT